MFFSSIQEGQNLSLTNTLITELSYLQISNIHGPHRIYLNNFSFVLIFPLAPPSANMSNCILEIIPLFLADSSSVKVCVSKRYIHAPRG